MWLDSASTSLILSLFSCDWSRRLDLNPRTSLPARLVQMLQGPIELYVAIKIGNQKPTYRYLS